MREITEQERLEALSNAIAIIKRNLPDTITLIITERKAAYMLEHGSSYAYIDSQGYILEISANPIE